jgi:fatty-acid desaturase
MLGESYHNDHHEHPSKANFGERWFEIDPVYYIILLLNKLHIVRLKTAVTPVKAIEIKKPQVSSYGL